MKLTFANELIQDIYNYVTNTTGKIKTYEASYGFEFLYELKNQIDILRATRHFDDYRSAGWTVVTFTESDNTFQIELCNKGYLIVTLIAKDIDDVIQLERCKSYV